MNLGKTIGGVAALSAAAILAWALLVREPAGSQPTTSAGAGASPEPTALAASRHRAKDAVAGKKSVGAPATGGHSEDHREHYAGKAESLRRRAAELGEESERRKAAAAAVAVAVASRAMSPGTQKKTRTTDERYALPSSTHSQVVARLGPHMERMRLGTHDQERAVAAVANLRDETKALALRDSPPTETSDVVARLVELRKKAEQELADYIGPEKAAGILLIENSTHLRQTIVADVAAQCTASGVPLSNETADRIAALCLQHSVLLHPSPGDDTLLLEEVKTILQPAQVAHLKERLAKRYNGK